MVVVAAAAPASRCGSATHRGARGTSGPQKHATSEICTQYDPLHIATQTAGPSPPKQISRGNTRGKASPGVPYKACRRSNLWNEAEPGNGVGGISAPGRRHVVKRSTTRPGLQFSLWWWVGENFSCFPLLPRRISNQEAEPTRRVTWVTLRAYTKPAEPNCACKACTT